jgi:transposase
MDKRYCVRLTTDERAVLGDLIAAGAAPARALAHARVLLKADVGPAGPGWTDARVAAAVEVSVATVARVRRRWAEGGLDDALHRRPTGPRRRALDGAQEAHLIALACTEPPHGRQRWSVRLLTKKLVELEVVEAIGRETVRTALKKTGSSRG